MSNNQNKKFYITTSIAYSNAKPHLGFALEILQADVIARYHKNLGDDVLFLTGTDEHGSKIARKAKENNKTPKEFCDEISKKFQDLKTILDLSNNDFIRTTDEKRHFPSVHKVWEILKNNGDIYKKKYKGLYCVGCEAFIKEKDLINGKCPIHKKDPEIIEEENYFFKLSKYEKQLKNIFLSNKIKIIPETRKNEMLGLIKQGLEDVSCSRDASKVKWGIPVFNDNTQTIYVWFEALINYISALNFAENSEKFNKYWPADVHCIGKDITRFHLLLWPAMLMSLGIGLPEKVLIHGFITANNEKMSKSLGNVIDPVDLANKYGVDAVRYFLLREITPTEDGDFSYAKIEQRYNSDLASGLGNLTARILTLSNRLGVVLSNKAEIFENEVNKIIGATKLEYSNKLRDFKFNEALKSIWDLIGFCDKYIEQEKPWQEKENSKQVINDLLIVLREITEMLSPFLPETSDKIKAQLKANKSKALFPRLT